MSVLIISNSPGVDIEAAPLFEQSAFDSMFADCAAPNLLSMFGRTVSFYAYNGDPVYSFTAIWAQDQNTNLREDDLGENDEARGTLQIPVASATALDGVEGEFEINNDRWAIEGLPVKDASFWTYRLVRNVRMELRAREYVQ